LVRACHDCSEGGLAVALAEMALAGGLGAEADMRRIPVGAGDSLADDWLLFSESNGRYLAEVRLEDAGAFEALLAAIPWACFGRVITQPTLSVTGWEESILALPVATIRRAWRGHLAGQEGER
jgi:phosphoribosylformylglycinamidine synthase